MLTRDHLRRLVAVAHARDLEFVALVDLAEINPGSAFQGVVLRNVDMRRQDLAGFDFSRARLQGCKIDGADFTKARGVTWAVLSGATYTEPPKLPPSLRASFWAIGRPPSWAHDWGCDNAGPWASFQLPDSSGMRLRWVLPMNADPRFSSFTAGPKSVAQGFWIFERRCTASLWWAVTGEPMAVQAESEGDLTLVPMEQAQAFAHALNAMVPGLALEVPRPVVDIAWQGGGPLMQALLIDRIREAVIPAGSGAAADHVLQSSRFLFQDDAAFHGLVYHRAPAATPEELAAPSPRAGGGKRYVFPLPWQPDWASKAGEDQYGRYADLTLRMPRKRPVTQRLRWIPPGRFLMGSPDTEEGRDDDEGPQHEVTIAEGFWLFDTPCTQAFWRAVMGGNPSRFQSPTSPVEQVSFDDIQQFLDKLNAAIPGLDLALPSEAQWEYACRAGSLHPTYAADLTHPDGTPLSLDDIAWHDGNSGDGFELANGNYNNGVSKGTHPVAQKAPNRWGLYDMLGNVYEWTLDPWPSDHEGAPTDGSPRPSGAAGRHVIRGGSWFDEPRRLRAAYRLGSELADRNDFLGFRCARVQRVSKAGASAEGGRSQPKGAERRAVTTSPERSAGGSSSPPPRRRQ